MKQDSPSTRRNRGPILAVLRELFPEAGRVLELGCVTGQHAAFLVQEFPDLLWEPTDISPEALASARAWAEEAQLSNVAAGRILDAAGSDWPEGPYDAAFSANVIHISPPEVTPGLVSGVGRGLRPGGVFVLYGPFKVDEAFTSESNARFEEWLKAKDPRFGVRDMEYVTALAGQAGMDLEALVAMPANNFCLVFKKAEADGAS
ncbi:MAG: DUF938 domain-containing protein [Myxococcota bacterium]|nr:DUF938 domain-containing protein [Myxococcota bacterium]